jgi:hypothetical protein
MLRLKFRRPVCLGVKHPSGAQTTVRQSRVCWCEAPFMTRGQVCRLQLLLAFASAVPLDSWPYLTVSDSRLPQPEGPGPRIYIPQEKDVTVIHPGTGFPFRRLLRLTGLRGRYSNPSYTWSLSRIFDKSVRISQEILQLYNNDQSVNVVWGTDSFCVCENHLKHINVLCGQNEELFNALKNYKDVIQPSTVFSVFHHEIIST